MNMYTSNEDAALTYTLGDAILAEKTTTTKNGSEGQS